MSATEATPRPANLDRGLCAVERVRGVRERDNRLGMQQALLEQQVAELRLARLEESYRAHGSFLDGDTGRFLAVRASMMALREAITTAQADVTTARSVALDASARWRASRSRLGAVEGLLDRRADERVVEARAAESTELDDVAGRLWLRRSRAQHEESHA